MRHSLECQNVKPSFADPVGQSLQVAQLESPVPKILRQKKNAEKNGGVYRSTLVPRIHRSLISITKTCHEKGQQCESIAGRR